MRYKLIGKENKTKEIIIVCLYRNDDKLVLKKIFVCIILFFQIKCIN